MNLDQFNLLIGGIMTVIEIPTSLRSELKKEPFQETSRFSAIFHLTWDLNIPLFCFLLNFSGMYSLMETTLVGQVAFRPEAILY